MTRRRYILPLALVVAGAPFATLAGELPAGAGEAQASPPPAAVGTDSANAEAPPATAGAAEEGKDATVRSVGFGQNTVLDPVTGAPVANAEKSWAVNAGVEFRSLVVADVDPQNDRSLSYWALGEYKPFKGGRAFLRIGLTQEFVAEEGESGLYPHDTQLGFSYAHSVALTKTKSLDLQHTGALWFPTSRSSRAQELRVAPDVRSMVSMDVWRGLTPGVDARFQYRFHRFAERAGTEGGLLPQLLVSGRIFARYPVWKFERFGEIDVGADLSSTWVKKYPSAEKYIDPTGASDIEPWGQRFGWSASVSYAPTTWLFASVALSQNASTLRDGIIKTYFFNRDETEMSFSVSARY